MKKVTILSIIIISILQSGCSIKKTALENENTAVPDSIVCPADTLTCPDGSTVGRTGANCEFTPCAQEPKASEEKNNDLLIVKVYFNNSLLNPNSNDCSKVFPKERIIPASDNLAKAALLELVKGPTEQEKLDGYNSLFSEKTKDVVDAVKFENETAYVNLKDIRQLIPNANASCGSAEFIAEIENTLKQFPSIKKVIFALNGQPSTFYEWMQIGCSPENKLCDETPFKTMK